MNRTKMKEFFQIQKLQPNRDSMEVRPQSSIQKTYLNVKRIHMGMTAAWTNNLETTIISLKIAFIISLFLVLLPLSYKQKRKY